MTEARLTVRRLAGLSSCVVLLVGLLEAISAVFWVGYGKTRLQYHLRTDLSSAIAAANFDRTGENSQSIYDRELGWVPDPRHSEVNRFGARRHGRDTGGDPEGVAFGDSFVYGDEVSADQTFPFYLSEKLDATVRNFGVSGFGPDQAVLRLERELANGLDAPVVVLGMPSENIARVVNVFFATMFRPSIPFTSNPFS